MVRKFVGPTACCLILSWAVFAAPRKDDPLPTYYHPSKVGDKLVYMEDNGRRLMEWGLEVTEVRQKGAALIVTIRGADGVKTPTFRYEVSDKGVCKLGEDDTVYDSPECFVRLPFKKGEKWETTDAPQDGEISTAKFTSAGEEEVEVQAGKFRCVRVDTEWVSEGLTWTRTQWLAPRCGMVKEVLVCTDKVGTEYAPCTTVLKSFTPASK
jgi:hypothetical protein